MEKLTNTHTHQLDSLVQCDMEGAWTVRNDVAAVTLSLGLTWRKPLQGASGGWGRGLGKVLCPHSGSSAKRGLKEEWLEAGRAVRGMTAQLRDIGA